MANGEVTKEAKERANRGERERRAALEALSDEALSEARGLVQDVLGEEIGLSQISIDQVLKLLVSLQSKYRTKLARKGAWAYYRAKGLDRTEGEPTQP